AVWHAADDRLTITCDGPSSQVRDTAETAKGYATTTGYVLTETIDDRVASDGLTPVTFIKMDIEGAELNALKGAEKTLRLWKPQLAISVYHRLEHFWQVPNFINSLHLDYRFYLDHFTMHSEETVLFASAV